MDVSKVRLGIGDHFGQMSSSSRIPRRQCDPPKTSKEAGSVFGRMRNHLVAGRPKQVGFRLDDGILPAPFLIFERESGGSSHTTPPQLVARHYQDFPRRPRLGIGSTTPRSPSTSFIDPPDATISGRRGARL